MTSSRRFKASSGVLASRGRLRAAPLCARWTACRMLARLYGLANQVLALSSTGAGRPGGWMTTWGSCHWARRFACGQACTSTAAQAGTTLPAG
ncbi:hypothetical protein D3C72_1950700 [compost metagenome]